MALRLWAYKNLQVRQKGALRLPKNINRATAPRRLLPARRAVSQEELLILSMHKPSLQAEALLFQRAGDPTVHTGVPPIGHETAHTGLKNGSIFADRKHLILYEPGRKNRHLFAA